MTRTAAPPSPVLTSATLDADVRGTSALLRPRGPFSLAQARRSVSRWAPTSRHGDRAGEPGGPLRVATVLDADHTPIALALSDEDGGVRVDVAGVADPDRVGAALAQGARMFSLDHDASGLAAVARRDPALGEVLDRHAGLRPVLFASPYEAAAWAVISPRIGKRQAAVLQRRLSEAHGSTLTVAGGEVASFPTPEALLRVPEFPGLPEEKLRRLHGVAEAALAGDLDIAALRALGPVGAREALRQVRGVGPFWASGIWLRACGVVDEWPDEPLCGAALAGLHGRDPEAPGSIDDLVAPLAPYRTWLAFMLRITA